MSQPTKTTSTSSSDKLTRYADVAKQYAADVVAGTIPACKWVRLACKRHLDDLIKADDPGYPYRFDAPTAGRVCLFVEQLPYPEGIWDTENIKLQPWQIWMTCSIFGWLKKADNLRRFRTAYISVPRKNAKSTWAGAIALYCLTLDGEFGAQIYCGATKMDQARYVFDPAASMASSSDRLRNKLGIEVAKKSIMVPKTNSRFKPLCRKPGDGGGAHLFILDEYHEATDNGLRDAMERGMGARRQPLTLITTTAGDNIAGPCHELELDCQKILDGVFTRESTFAAMWGLDPEVDDWTTLESARKANPNWGISVFEQTYKQELEAAIQNATYQNSFKTKRLNVWCNAASGWLNMQDWAACKDPDLKPEDYHGKPCVIGLDLAQTTDLTALVKVFRKQVDGVDHYYVTGSRYYLPEDRTGDPSNPHYQRWVHQGILTATEGAETDYARVEADLLDIDAKLFTISELCYDPANAAYLTQRIISDQASIERVQIRQNAMTLTPPMRLIEGMVKSRRIHHDGDPILAWCLSNIEVRPDANDMLLPRKARRESKIDAGAALIIAMARAMAIPISKPKGFRPFYA